MSALPIPRIATTVAGIPVRVIAENVLQYTAGFQIDGDGSGGNAERDPDFQADTSLHVRGTALNSRTTVFIAIPPKVRNAVPGVVLGARCHLRNVVTGAECEGVVGDIGPADKLGEGSIYAAQQLGIPSNPRKGGTSRNIVEVTIFAGVPGMVAGLPVKLQPFAG